MKTRELIETLGRDAKAKTPAPAAVLLGAGLAAIVLAAVLFALLIGPRPDIAAAAATPRFLLKFAVTAALALAAAVLLLPLARPGARLGSARLLLAAPLLLGAAVAAEFLLVPPEDWGARWIGTNIAVCLTYIPLIGIGPLALFLAALRHGAPTRPALAGAVAGVLAGGIAATFYAAHCTDDSPFFVATWYTLAIAALALVGALAGRRLLRW